MLLLHMSFHILSTCVVGRRLPHPTQLDSDLPSALHPGRVLPAEGVQYSHPLPGGDTRLRPGKRGKEERRGEVKRERGGAVLRQEQDYS